MTDSELLDRVAAWLASRGLTPTPGEGLWDACSGSWGASSPPALGCLLALVREAWGPTVNIMERVGPSPTAGTIVISRGPDVLFSVVAHDDRAGRLVAALEAAPQPGAVTP